MKCIYTPYVTKLMVKHVYAVTLYEKGVHRTLYDVWLKSGKQPHVPQDELGGIVLEDIQPPQTVNVSAGQASTVMDMYKPYVVVDMTAAEDDEKLEELDAAIEQALGVLIVFNRPGVVVHEGMRASLRKYYNYFKRRGLYD